MALFNRAASYVASGSFLDISVSDKLYFYSRYKQATEGPCNIPKPGFFDLQGKKKWEAWNDLKQLDKEEASKQYVMKLTEIDPMWQSVAPLKTGWVTVSTMMKEDPIADADKTVFDYVQENNLEKVNVLSLEELEKLDENGMSTLHWACDRGYLEMVQKLLEKGLTHLNTQDSEGQTPLHYASSCCHKDVIKLLIKNNANVNLKDNNGSLAEEYATDEDIKELFKT
ncbi:UNVERIFIED_CONTAM: hypothetical protein GTU68_042777 [Idotea baltica]|nr:hypothetical protein [Idotea baltica]